MEQSKPIISQKEYLKRYLMKDKDKKTKKKKKQEKVSSSTHLKRSVIIDDDINISEIPRVVDDEFTLDHLGDEAPQIVGVIDERPEQVKLAEKYDSGKWRPMGAEEEKSKASVSAKRPSEDDLWGVRPGRRGTRNFDDVDLSPPRAKDKSGGKGRIDDKRKSRCDKIDRWESGDKSDSDLEVPRSQARPLQRTGSKTAQSKFRPRSDGSDSDTSASQRKKRNGGWSADSKSSKRDQRKRRGSSSDVSPPRKNKRDQDSDISPSGRTNGGSDSDISPPRRKTGRDSGRTPPRRSKGGSDSDLSPPRKRRGGGDSELSPHRRNKGGDGRDSSPPRRRKGGSDSDLSPTRKRKGGNDSVLPSLRRKRDGSGRDPSPPRRRKGGSDSDLSPPRKQKGGGDTDLSLPRRKKDGGGRDPSPPSTRKGGSDSDLSPPRRRKAGSDSDLSPPRKRKGGSNSDLSPPRRKKGDRDRDRSPPRRRKGGGDSDLSPPRRKKVDKTSGRSPPRRRKDGSDSDLSPPRRKAGYGDTDLSPPRNRRKDRDQAMEKQKSDQMQDGKKAGLQDAKSLKDELRILKEKEDEMFKQMDPELLGRSTQAVVRDRRTGLKRDFDKEREIERQKAAKDAVRQKKYEKWGKGLKQVREQEERVADMVHEMSKPLARYAGDNDLERALKAQEREGDPMLEYIRRHQKESHTIDLTVGGMRKKYQGSYLPNRFNIPPGHRWDGVDRSNGYEQKWFAAKNAKKATAEEAWKWSSSDM